MVYISFIVDAFGARGRASTGDQAAVPPDSTLYLYVQLAERKTAKQNEAEEKGIRPYISANKYCICQHLIIIGMLSSNFN